MRRPPLSISAAARLCGVDRRTLQRAIHAGRLRLDARQGLRQRDLVAAGYLVPEPPQATPQPAPHEERLAALLQRLCEAIEGLRHEVRLLSCATPQTTPQAAPSPEAFDATKYRLGGLCEAGHAWQGTGQTLRRVPSGVCPQCQTAQQRTRRAARRNGARAPQGRGNGG